MYGKTHHRATYRITRVGPNPSRHLNTAPSDVYFATVSVGCRYQPLPYAGHWAACFAWWASCRQARC